MIKKQLFPKTVRFNEEARGYQITEKMDGANLGIGKFNGELVIAQREIIFSVEEAKTGKVEGIEIYKGFPKWIAEHEEFLKENIYEGSIVFGEWLELGKIHYEKEKFPKRFLIFAKGRFESKTIEESSIVNLNFNLNLIHYVFVKQEIPYFIETVPLVESKVKNVSLDYLNQLYSEYSEKVGRKVEGFVILDLLSGIQTKYVRLKRGKLTEHKA